MLRTDDHINGGIGGKVLLAVNIFLRTASNPRKRAFVPSLIGSSIRREEREREHTEVMYRHILHILQGSGLCLSLFLSLLYALL